MKAGCQTVARRPESPSGSPVNATARYPRENITSIEPYRTEISMTSHFRERVSARVAKSFCDSTPHPRTHHRSDRSATWALQGAGSPAELAKGGPRPISRAVATRAGLDVPADASTLRTQLSRCAHASAPLRSLSLRRRRSTSACQARAPRRAGWGRSMPHETKLNRREASLLRCKTVVRHAR